MTKLTPQQNQLLRRLLQAGPRGLNPDDIHTATLDGLLRRRLATTLVTAQGLRAVLSAPTKTVRRGSHDIKVVDLDGVEETA